ncbi:hypothetical protein L1987_83467 [Smallanthus sonchifolius]|uniref:Uncharacterized protein n=1 Tax=Smallanthus sonchifolius TaxID=185202 RepID=A0ACB8YBH3_9ASTR|nr:hypothetical protein L1987_83467 [Smallanthus sonchifolius]
MEWLDVLPLGTITTWAEMTKQFLLKYFPPDKTAKLRSSITGFRQDDDESLHAAWERYKTLLRRCPHHGLDLWLQCQTFYDAISGAHKQAVDECAAGDFGGATATEAFQTLEKSATKRFAYNPLRAGPTQKGMHHAIEKKVGQMAQLLSERPQGSLPSNTVPNHNAQVNAVTLRSGKTTKNGAISTSQQTTPKECPNDTQEVTHPPAEKPTKEPVRIYVPPLPYPGHMRKEKLEKSTGNS